MTIENLIQDFKIDWQLSGRSQTTIDTYCRYLYEFVRHSNGCFDLPHARAWLSTSISAETARGRGRALRAFGRWSEQVEEGIFVWWSKIPLQATPPTPQATATESDLRCARRVLSRPTDRLIVELLWSSGARLSEIAAIRMHDVDVNTRSILIRRSKTGQPRLVPVSLSALRLIRRVSNRQEGAKLITMSTGAIQQMLRRHGLPSPHAWRRGWAANSLRSGVSQVSVQRAGGWNSPSMVNRYVAAVSDELAMLEFANHQID